MNRKNNPWVSLIALLLLAVLLVLICTGCGATTTAEAATTTEATTTEATETIETTGSGFSADLEGYLIFPSIKVYVITDNETGVQYLYVEGTQGSGLTVRQPAETVEE